MYDYSYYATQIQPLSRELYEAMQRHEWEDADKIAEALEHVVFEVRRQAIAQMTLSGQGYIYHGK